MEKLVNSVDLKSTAFWLAGSSPAGGTKWNLSSVGRASDF